MRQRLPAVMATCAVLAALVSGCGTGEGRYRLTPEVGPAVPKAFLDLEELDAPKRYVTRVFKPDTAIRVPAGKWKTRAGDAVFGFSIEPEKTAEPVDGAYLAISRITRVFEPHRGGRVARSQVRFDGDFASWLTGHAHLITTPPRRISMLGLSGVQLDVTARESPWQIPHECGAAGPNCVPLYHDGLDFDLYTSTSKGRFIVLDLPSGPQLVIEEHVRPAYAFQEGLAVLRPLLDGLSLER